MVKVPFWVSRAHHVLFFVAYAALAAPTWGQGTDARPETAAKLPEFEVATIKLHPEGDYVMSSGPTPGGFEAHNATVKLLVEQAFDLPGDQVTGGPGWVASQHFDVVARMSDAERDAISKLDYRKQAKSIGLMLQSLLKERFQLKITHQPKELMIYALVVAKGGAKLRAAGAPKPPDSPETGQESFMVKMEQKDISVSELTPFLSSYLHRAVLDRTELSGKYDVSLKIPMPDNSLGDMNSAMFRALEEALEDQLGLKLVSRRDVVDTIVIQHVEQPSEN
jgi:uncharacterized protein (TIGR03435 family)